METYFVKVRVEAVREIEVEAFDKDDAEEQAIELAEDWLGVRRVEVLGVELAE